MNRISLVMYRLNKKAQCAAFPTQREAKGAQERLKSEGATCIRMGPYVPEKEDISPHHLGVMLVSSVRYALGRQTYIVAETAHIVRTYLKMMNSEDIIVMARDIGQASKEGRLGMECDMHEWEILLSQLIQHLKEFEVQDALTT